MKPTLRENLLKPEFAKLARPGAHSHELVKHVPSHDRVDGLRQPQREQEKMFDSILIARAKDFRVPNRMFFCSSHPNIRRAEKWINSWGNLKAELFELISFITPCHEPFARTKNFPGCSCGSDLSRPFGLWTTVDSVVGISEGIFHEMAHQKLRHLGVTFDDGGLLLNNPATQTDLSPIRLDVLRPISAILHAQYSYSYVFDVYLHALKEDLDNDEKHELRLAISRVLSRLRFGRSTLLRLARPTNLGEQFLTELWRWFSEMEENAIGILGESAIEPLKFVHPLASGDSAVE